MSIRPFVSKWIQTDIVLYVYLGFIIGQTLMSVRCFVSIWIQNEVVLYVYRGINAFIIGQTLSFYL